MKRLILFDIDGTILHSQGVGRVALTRALSQSCNQPIRSDHLDLSGKTDPQILEEMLVDNGLKQAALASAIDNTFSIYPAILKEEISQAKEFSVLAGVHELIDALNKNDSAYLGLLTGNIELGARLKLEPFGLNEHFAFGAFGCDSKSRLDLPAIAVERASKYFACAFERQEVVIIGDSVLDIACAKHYGAVVIAVASGRTPMSELESHQPDFLFSTLTNVDQVVKAIFDKL